MSIKRVVKPFVPKSLLTARLNLLTVMNAVKPFHERRCPICGYEGYFAAFGRPPRPDARCKRCGSLERHRLFWLWFKGDKSKMEEPILHFAPEPILRDQLRRIYSDYKTADLFDVADLNLNIEQIDLPTGSLNTVICNHVLEHVSDRKALAEIYRVLSDKGRLVCSVPIVEGWESTYENDSISTPRERELHFGQHDHVRYYGRDFRDRLRAAGFVNIEEVTASGQDVVDYGLVRGEKFFICSKS